MRWPVLWKRPAFSRAKTNQLSDAALAAVAQIPAVGLSFTPLDSTMALFSGPIPSVGNAAPDFTLNSQDGSPVSLKDHRGKWVVLYFYPRDMTPGCTIEARNFERDQDQYARKNVVVLGISVDSKESHQKFCAREGLNFKLLSDSEKTVSKKYGSLINLAIVKFSSRHTFIIDPQGNIAWVYTDVDPKRHSQEVLAKLDELQDNASRKKPHVETS